MCGIPGPPEVWAKCWSSVLEALASAARDQRLGVRCHALCLLTETLIDMQSTF
jgi:hypothetical protein